jgi:hypothetical protein
MLYKSKIGIPCNLEIPKTKQEWLVISYFSLKANDLFFILEIFNNSYKDGKFTANVYKILSMNGKIGYFPLFDVYKFEKII